LFVQFPSRIANRAPSGGVSSRVIDFLKTRGVQVSLPYFPAHRLAEFSDFAAAGMRWTDHFYEALIEVPTQPTLDNHQIDYVCETLIASLKLVEECTSAGVG
jgi:dTDP-4-amino-4,6-dideoxygalactose transaminase